MVANTARTDLIKAKDELIKKIKVNKFKQPAFAKASAGEAL
jgi:hypothetical protein